MADRAERLVFVPAWNEEENLPAVLEELAATLPAADVLVVDDGSTDATADVARAGGAQVVRFDVNRGLQSAIAAGYGYAAEHGYRFCGRVDADGQHPAAELTTRSPSTCGSRRWRVQAAGQEGAPARAHRRRDRAARAPLEARFAGYR